ncbi:MAG: NACHT domain-containing protein [Candidatus Poribacteria bacterium]|nr:NACHT domain-containing protein [Candidatus Poribacteria bacterium]
MFEKIGIGILTKVVPGFLKEAWETIKNRHQKSKNASHDYSNHYKKRHGQIIVTCVGMEPARSLDEVYVAMQFLDKRRAATYGSIEDIEEALQERKGLSFASTSDERQEGMRVANNEQYLMVLGGPGVGKSTFLRKIGLEVLKGEEGNFEHACIPIFLELKRFTEDQINIESWITEEFKICGYPYPEQMASSALKCGELLILLDGLDEVPKSNINNVYNKIRDFVDQYSENRFIISCRPAAYTGGFTGFAVVEVAEFDDTQIQAYINNWFASGSNRKVETAQQCWEALDTPENQAIRALAQNPLSLVLLCAIYEDSQTFPSNRTILYERILNIFLKKWTAEKQVHRDPPVSPHLAFLTVKEMLSEIAAKNFKADCVLFSENGLINQIQDFFQGNTNIPTTFDASKTLDTILVDPGLFVERANGVYSFLHLTFQEYLTANYFVNTQSVHRLVAEHLHDERWREVFLFAAELMPEADSLLLEMEAKAAKSIDTYRLKTLFQWTKCITNTANNLYNGLTKRTFAILQYFSLWLFSKIDEVVKDDINPNPGPNLDFHLDLNLDPDFDDDFYKELYLDFYQSIYLNLDLYLYLYQNLDIDLDFYLDFYRGVNLDIDMNLDMFLEINFYLYLCGYMEIYFYTRVPPEAKDRFDAELGVRMKLVKRIEQAKIFKNVDLQRMVHRFDDQRKFIKALQEENVVKPPEKSIHNTWLSVLKITDDMLAISRSEVKSCLQYLWLVELIIACKESAGHVSPEVWQKIEDRLLTWDVEEVRN